MTADPATTSYRVARLSLGFPPRRDGLSHHVHLLSRYQSHLGHRVDVFVPHGETLADDNIRICPVPPRGRRLDPRRRLDRWRFGWLAARQIMAAHRTNPFDVIHCHGDVSDVLAVGRANQTSPVPVILTLHAALSRNLAYQRLAPWAFKSVTRFIGVGQHIKDGLVALGVDAKRISVITSGIEFDRWQMPTRDRTDARQRLGLPTDGVLAVAVGRLHPMKGFEHLIAAAARLPSGIRVAVVGDGPLGRRFQAEGQRPNLIWLGSQPHRVMPGILAAADIFVLPSVDLPKQAEGTPTALLEAMASGLPAVVTDSGGGHHLINSTHGGIVVAQRDNDGLADALTRLARDGQTRSAMGDRNRDAARRHDWSVITGQVIDVYGEARAMVECT